MNKKDYKYEIDDEFINDKISYRIVDRYIDVQHRKEGFNEYIKRYVIHCNKCGAERVLLRESQKEACLKGPNWICNNKKCGFENDGETIECTKCGMIKEKEQI